MNSSELKYNYEINNPEDGYFFTRSTMKFFGDTMKNYGVITHADHYELHRKRPVGFGLQNSAYFDKDTFKLISSGEMERRSKAA
jgi:aromatic ring-opening dioxygenase LigB subunit